jgi:hypothetical protein
MDAFGPKLSDAQVIVLADARIEAERPQGTAALTVSGTGDSLTAAPTWATATILTADATALAGNCAIDVASCPDGASRWLRLTPASAKTVTISATGGSIKRLGGLDTNPITGDGTVVSIVSIARIGTIYEITINAETTFS